MNSSGFRIPKGHRGQLSGNGHQRHDTEPELPVVQGSEPEKAPVGTVAMVMLILGLIGSVVYLAAR